MRYPVLTGLLLLFALPVSAQYCRWQDDQGTVHYAKECPQSAQAKEIDLQSPPSREEVEAANARSAAVLDDVGPGPAAQETAANNGSRGRASSSDTIDAEDVKCPRSNKSRYVDKMSAICESKRSALIEPARKREMEECMDRGDRTEAQCKRYLADLFNPNYIGRLEPRAFDYVKECVIADVCRKDARMEDETYRGRWDRLDRVNDWP